MIRSPMATVTDVDLAPDPSRVLAKPFIPGLEDVGPTGSRAGAVVSRLMRLDEDELARILEDLTARFSTRHRDLLSEFEHNAERVLPLIDAPENISRERLLVIGAYFTHEYSIEGAALANPSIVPHPVQDRPGALRFIMSVRCIGEGHRSAIGFRTGTISRDGGVEVDIPSHYVTHAIGEPWQHSRRVLHARLDHLGYDFDEISQLLLLLPPTFDNSDLNAALAEFSDTSQVLTSEIGQQARDLSHWSYQVHFKEESEISERVLWPFAPPEYHGLEDARFVRFTQESGDTSYLATYTAFDRNNISVQLLQTTDFQSFTSSPVAGSAAVGKGLAIFPRRIDDCFAALTRSDRESNGIAFSEDLHHWESSVQIQFPREPWELVQLGNCGPPIEIAEGWLVLMHGVGPMRTYAIGALLLDLDDPTRVIGRTRTPILEADEVHREGYVPNVVYSCGALVHAGTLVLPFGYADQRIGVATMQVSDLLSAMES